MVICWVINVKYLPKVMWPARGGTGTWTQSYLIPRLNFFSPHLWPIVSAPFLVARSSGASAPGKSEPLSSQYHALRHRVPSLVITYLATVLPVILLCETCCSYPVVFTPGNSRNHSKSSSCSFFLDVADDTSVGLTYEPDIVLRLYICWFIGYCDYLHWTVEETETQKG